MPMDHTPPGRRRVLKLLSLPTLATPYQRVRAAERPLRLVVGFAAGGSLDLIARALAERLRDELGQPVIVENKAGAGSLLAAEAVARAEPDGTTLLIAPVVVTAFFPHLYKKLAFDPLKDLVPVAQLGTFQFALAVGARDPAPDLAAFVRRARANPGKGTFGSVSPGTPSHFLGVMFNRAVGTDLQHVPYKGAAPALTALQGGEIESAFVPAGNVVELQRAGRVKVLAVTGRTRSPMLPDVPTFDEGELALKAMQDASLWYGFFAPARTAPADAERLSAALARALANAEVASRVSKLDVVVAHLPPAEFARVVRRDAEQWGAVIRASGFTLQD